MPRLVLSKSAAKYFERLDERIKVQLREKLRQLGTHPDSMPGIKRMQGDWEGYFRMRHGNLRVIFSYNRTQDEIGVHEIGPRGDIYK